MATKCIDNQSNYDLIEIHTADQNVNDIANEYIRSRHINVKQSVGFNSLLLYISKNIEIYPHNVDDKHKYDDVNIIDYYFSIYTELCSICTILPDLTGFSIMSDIPYETLKQWRDGDRRLGTAHGHLAKKWNSFCKCVCVAEAGRGNVGAIYVSKAIHGLSDQVAPPQLTQNNVYINAPMDRGQIMAELGRISEKKQPEIIEIDRVNQDVVVELP